MAKQSMMMMLPISSAQDELSIWEFVNQSESDVDSDFEVQSFDLDDELFSSSSSSMAFDDVDGHGDDHGHSVDQQEVKSFDLDDDLRHPSSLTDDDHDEHEEDDDDGVVAKDDDVKCDDHDVGIDVVYDHDDGYGMGDEVGTHERRKSLDMTVYTDLYDDQYGVHFQHDVVDDGDDDHHHGVDEDDDGYGLDDELVPWDVKDVYERQRIRKSGKKSLTKFTKSKKPAVVFTRNGCVRGKYALGLKAR